MYISKEVVDYYSKLIHNEIKIVMMHINAAGINVWKHCSIVKKTAEKNIVKREELRQYNSMDIILAPGTGKKILNNISSRIRINKKD